ncbi:MAG: hypothetical protein AB1411_04105 [Nitrospirota bacterium]
MKTSPAVTSQASTRLSEILGVGALFVLVSACASGPPSGTVPTVDALPAPAIPRLQGIVQIELDRRVSAAQTVTLTSLRDAIPASHAQDLVAQGLPAPWAGMSTFERYGLRLAGLARSGSIPLSELLETLAATGNIVAASAPVPPVPEDRLVDVQMAFLTSVLQQAGQFREHALRKLNKAERQFLFDHAATLVEQFTPQVDETDERTSQQVQAMQRFCDLVGRQIDQTSLLAAAQVLARLDDDRWLGLMEEIFADQPAQPPPPGVTGDVLLVRETPAGLIVIGDRGPNRYHLDQRFALILDLGGDDLYEGAIAAPASPERGISVILDLSGHDAYRASPLGLATGRLGVGLLVDRFGDDTYELAIGSGGTGFAGIGILDDREGADRYIGATFTQGAALGGLGLLMDRLGEDRFTSFGYSLGFGGPLGLGAVLDGDGDDRYECGDHLASAYNIEEHPEAKRDDPFFQYDCFGLGAGSGFRVVRRDGETLSFDGVAGGEGWLLDLAGDDRYRSANFSQGAGYFFGAGIKLDLAGHDQHLAARYGLGAAAHGGLGLHVDYEGYDRYGSTGPHYDGGAAWDRSVALCLDAGTGDDRYDLSKSDGLGLADLGAWGLFVDEGGKDRYLVPTGMGTAHSKSLGGFFDLAEEDEYVLVPASASGQRDNGQILTGEGALFLDR